jgi:hypothetical protein
MVPTCRNSCLSWYRGPGAVPRNLSAFLLGSAPKMILTVQSHEIFCLCFFIKAFPLARPMSYYEAVQNTNSNSLRYSNMKSVHGMATNEDHSLVLQARVAVKHGCISLDIFVTPCTHFIDCPFKDRCMLSKNIVMILQCSYWSPKRATLKVSIPEGGGGTWLDWIPTRGGGVLGRILTQGNGAT